MANVVQLVSGSLSASQIGNLYSTPVQLVATPGVGLQIQILTASFGRYEGKDGDWAGGGGGDGHNTVRFQYGATPLGAGSSALAPATYPPGSTFGMFDDAVLLSPSSNAVGVLPGVTMNADTDHSNQSICVSATSNFINVNAGDVTKWSIAYFVFPV